MSKDINLQSSDKDIIEDFLNGNGTAFNLLVLKYRKKVYWVIRKMVIDHDDADDITQEVFLKLYKSLNDFRGDSSLFTYLYKIAINYSLNHLKKNKKKYEREKFLDEDSHNIKDENADTEALVDKSEKEKLLKEAILILPAQQRAVFSLRFYEELSYEDIGKILDKSVGGLKANYFHAFKKIQAFLIEKKQKGLID
ncbi:MAG: sigma-70 family RNA polymerase sigma factor [Ignavibacteria bacterium]|nr:sigma-70 family RNA polymerase sigma factor [Ignavibacteria bacterium]